MSWHVNRSPPFTELVESKSRKKVFASSEKAAYEVLDRFNAVSVSYSHVSVQAASLACS